MLSSRSQFSEFIVRGPEADKLVKFNDLKPRMVLYGDEQN